MNIAAVNPGSVVGLSNLEPGAWAKLVFVLPARVERGLLSTQERCLGKCAGGEERNWSGVWGSFWELMEIQLNTISASGKRLPREPGRGSTGGPGPRR